MRWGGDREDGGVEKEWEVGNRTTTKKKKKKKKGEAEEIVPASQLGEMSFDERPGDETDVFSLRSTISFPINFPHKSTGAASLNEKTRNEGAGLLYRQCRALYAEDGSDKSTLELLRSDWLKLEPLVLDNPGPVCLISKAI